jgi:hypothetical protein
LTNEAEKQMPLAYVFPINLTLDFRKKLVLSIAAGTDIWSGM